MDNFIYAVSKTNNEYRTLNPHIAMPAFSAAVSLGGSYGQITGATFADGDLLISDQNGDVIYAVDVMTNAVSVYDAISPYLVEISQVRLQDLFILSTNIGGGALYELMVPAADMLVGNMPASTGLTATSS